MLNLLYSPTSPLDVYLGALKFKIQIITELEQSDGDILILPEALDINPTIVGFIPEFRRPPYSEAKLDMYLEYFFQYLLTENLKFRKIVALGASAGYLHSAFNHKLSYNSQSGVFLKHPLTKLPCTKYTLDNMYINLANFSECKEEVIKFITDNDGPKLVKHGSRPSLVH